MIHVHNPLSELQAYADAARANGFPYRPVISPSLDLLTRTSATG